MPSPASASLSPAIRGALACPHCRGALTTGGSGARCDACNLDYGRTGWGVLDLRLQRETRHPATFRLGPVALDPPAADPTFRPMPINPAPEVDLSGLPRANLSAAFLSRFIRARAPGSLMLDLGCGTGLHRHLCEATGHEWVGVDYSDRGALLLGDAHSLPFRDQVFDCVLTVQVFEHLRYPFVAMEEIGRVLRPGGTLLGTVAFIEPFHGDSYYHHSPLGTLNTLRHAGFDVQYVSPFVHWSGLLALTAKGLYPRIPLRLASALTAPLRWGHLLWWSLACRLGLTTPEKRLRNTTAAFAFVARRPVE